MDGDLLQISEAHVPAAMTSRRTTTAAESFLCEVSIVDWLCVQWGEEKNVQRRWVKKPPCYSVGRGIYSSIS